MRIGVAGDIHAPFTHPLYLKFCQDVFDQWRVKHIHLIGDVADHHAISQWDADANGLSAEDEHCEASGEIERWYQTFRKATVSVGNHDERHFRLAGKHGLPVRYLRSYAELWRTPQWDWQFEHCHDGVLYTHGTGCSGKNAAISLAIQRRSSTVIGHTHTYAGVTFHANPDNRIFGLNTGCGIDTRAYAFAYGRDNPVRPVLGCSVVIDGDYPIFFPMPCGPKEKYHRDRAKRRRAA
jgi:predicted phosphodiesterase